MPLSNPGLWAAIQAHQPVTRDRTLGQALCRAFDVRARTAEDAIVEYRRFLYLGQVADIGVVAPRSVRAVQRIHAEEGPRDHADLLSLLPRPSTAQDAGRRRDRTAFDETKMLYRAEFGFAPPHRLWPETGLGVLPLILGVAGFGLAGAWFLAAGISIEPLVMAGLGSVLLLK
ncbi:hypothetical protein [Jannaschia donghaensis]|uniref:Uncharacterized protein n=1 Tax=Jannaschia donghaensis TaxID=420998 RepID=A0A0M6YM16_9RHOB|nr:hypothetical protein [Jannaschia donghaensis]CTQ50944.1 hypothetical protein JDO7802_02975 [Jannaschia donghaensis]